ncbi:MAG: type II toxin-antitoxin system Phd/YefM family antitoxin [Eggerthellaceae bacterium]|jgi:PHD/YefM family antitoxin component YafN of YafNO toxin-antitoxin module|nr:type II toxin-antitoxin system Phd/YefM family antitoxin [Eggerthellaceae bacterium]MDR2715698.1 type II toxin-antitoxin system Phd/YefM family antitoxin [Coriobacteriaceae bacterium]
MAAMTAREFNQHTGRAKLLARQEPLFITERGRTEYVLLSIDEYNEIKDSGKTLADLVPADEGRHYALDFDRFIPGRDEWIEREVGLS